MIVRDGEQCEGCECRFGCVLGECGRECGWIVEGW